MKLLAIADDLTPGKAYPMAYRQTLSYYTGVTPRFVHERAANSQYVQTFSNEKAIAMLTHAGFTPMWGSVNRDSVWFRFWDYGKDADSFRIEGADFIRTTDMESACGEAGILVESVNTGYTYKMRDGNYLTQVKNVLDSADCGYEEARISFARTKATDGIKAARKQFRARLFTAMMLYGSYDPNGYGPGYWNAHTEEQILPALQKAIEEA